MTAASDEPDFFLLLAEAQEAASAVDNFDLRSDAESQAEFRRLCTEQAAACIALVQYVVAHQGELESKFREMPE